MGSRLRGGPLRAASSQREAHPSLLAQHPRCCGCRQIGAVRVRRDNCSGFSKILGVLVTRDAKTLCGIFGDLVPQRPHRDAKQARRHRSVPMTISKGFQDQIPLDIAKGGADQPPSETAARRTRNRSARRYASHCATLHYNAHSALHQKTAAWLMIY